MSLCERKIRFRHADGTGYGGRPSAPASAAQTQVFQALRGLGFAERACREALEETKQELGGSADAERELRHALHLLTKSISRAS